MELTPLQTLILWALLASRGEVYQKDIKPEVKRNDREALVRLGLVVASKRTRGAFVLEVTDKGWAWAADHLDSALPTNSNAGSRILQGWLTALGIYLRAHGIALSEVLAPAPTPPKPIDPPVGDTSLRDRIRDAYLEVTEGSFNRRALLRHLRDKLRNIDRPTLDAALLRMQVEDDAALMPLDNHQEITDADREAAIQIGAEERHLLWIER